MLKIVVPVAIVNTVVFTLLELECTTSTRRAMTTV
jgi:hypothetical protein